MVCFYCGQPAQVINSRPNKRNNQVWRRRRCTACRRVWSTYEAPDYASAIVAQSDDGQLTPLSRDRLLLSIYQACRHRPDPIGDAAAICTTVLNQILKVHDSGAIPTREIARLAAAALDRFDTAAGVQYRAFHQSAS